MRPTNTSVISSKVCQAQLAYFLPLPLNAEVVLQPEYAWKKGRARDLGSPTSTNDIDLIKSVYLAHFKSNIDVSQRLSHDWINEKGLQG